MISFIAAILIQVLRVLYGVVHDWGLAILLLTLLLRVLIWPLTRKQVESMKQMQALQPQLTEIRETYKNDQQKQSEETMRLYMENKVNPFSGCWPLLIQMPVLIAMFTALRDPRFLKMLPGFDTASFLGIRLIVRPMEVNPFPEIELLPGMIDLSQFVSSGPLAPYFFDRYFYGPAWWLFLLYAFSSVVFSKLASAQNPQSQDPTMKMMNYMLIPMMIWFGLIFPNGLLLYFVMSNLAQLAQQKITPRPAGELINTLKKKANGEGKKKHKVAKAVQEEKIIDVEPES